MTSAAADVPPVSGHGNLLASASFPTSAPAQASGAGATASPRPPLRRPPRRAQPPCPSRALAGVCAGLSAHLGLPVGAVRLALMVLTVSSGAGALLYLLLWALVPTGDPLRPAPLPPARARLASRLAGHAADQPLLTPRMRGMAGGAALLLAAALLAAWRQGAFSGGAGWLLPLVLVAAGAALAWSQADALTGPTRESGTILRLAGGVVLAAVGILLWIGDDTPPRVLLTGALTGGALVLGIGLVLAPLWLRTNRALSDTRAAEAREAERADIAAHLHDSVLQTLTLIRKRADDPETVARLARSQERELRAWLYTDRPEAATSAADALRDLAAEIEDRHGVEVELVVVGDRPPDPDTEIVIAATREALSNAVRHGAPPVSAYAEITANQLDVFVRDHGAGFDLAEVAPDRHGVKESIIGRMERHGGHASVRRRESGTEVHLSLKTAPSPSTPAYPPVSSPPAAPAGPPPVH
ncbi:PspC domain-containing protein [Actinomyces sp. 594]|uniref:ATP-binding protein n=1 Tax=Actinomyces sp. 594 TaxID=2057793 RepID=UPI001C5997C3|nr:ATP-binding protein [Actinomyces sp. 594]MBW3068767.1 PspC domain-containing protein [Actinomyces sp. 594]